MDSAAAAPAATGNLPPSFSAAAAKEHVYYYLDPALCASAVPPARLPAVPTAAEVARRRHEEEDAGIRLVHLLVTCAGAIQAGDYSGADDNLTQARSFLAAITSSTGIGRVARHFVDALAQRLVPAHPQAAPPPATAAELHSHFYDAGPYLKFAYSTANQAILDAFEGCDHVHVVDLALMQGRQWPALIEALSQRHGGPPYLRITGIGGAGDELGEVGIRLEQLARSLDVPFTFREVRVEQLDGLRHWMLGVVPGEALAFNSVLQLHRLLVDPDADPAVPAPIDTLLHLVTSLQPRVFTVVEHEADHNRPALVERLTNALFHYAAMFDSMEAASHRTGGGGATSALAEACLRAEILDVVCGEGSARAERHEPVGRWRERLARAGLTQLPFRADEARRATAQLIRATLFSATGYGVLELAGSLALAWHDRPLYAATAWRATGGDAAGAAAVATGERDDKGRRRNSRNGSGESNGRGNRATA
ncbi:DELLA protein SLR1-like [Panicum virgatum]|uniref:DELLA protein DWARF8 n=1 Tax=Panicum virgatum TaxID=38727 RepID=A0A8T0X2X0_PANVG|nr:DELLA protein SLR1-like [Panicum virgatum]KAG2651674.1 hypothetical protein PVAP13_1NG302719 [Panicum virgatum]